VKKTLITVLTGSIALAGCSSLPQLPAEITTVTSETTAIAEAVCAFEPTAATISGVVASLFPGGGAIDTVATGAAQAICQAVTAKGFKLGSTSPPMVGGIAIEGHFVSKSAKLAMKKKLMLNGVIINGQFIK
jgi:hypothetical protein